MPTQDPSRRRALQLARYRRLHPESAATSARRKKNADRVLLGLAVSALSLGPGQCRSVVELAAYCACSKQAIDAICASALRKLRRNRQIQALRA